MSIKSKFKRVSILRVFRKILNYQKGSKFFQLFLIVTFLLAGTVFLKVIFQPRPGWWRFSAAGSIYHQPAYYKGLLFFGNGYSNFFAVDSRSGKSRWDFTAENGISSKPVIHRGRVLFESFDGTLFSLKADTGEEVWRFSTDQHYTFSSQPKVLGSTVFVSDAGGTLYAISVNSGELLWTFDSKTPETISSIHSGISLRWRDYVSVKGRTVYFASKDGYLYAISIKFGELKWKHNTKSAITAQPEIIGPNIFVGNKNGDTFALSRIDGSVVWHHEGEGNPVTCLKRPDPLGEFSNPSDNLLNLATNFVLKTKLIGDSSIIEVKSNEGVIKRGANDGKEIWKKEIDSELITCPNKWFSYLYFGDLNGKLRAINESDGSEIWGREVNDKVFLTPVLSYNSRSPINSPILYFVTTSGKIHALNARTGKELWNFSTFLQIYSPPIIRNSYLYVGSVDGGLYRIKYNSGKLDEPTKNNKIEVKQALKKVGDSEITVLTFSHDDTWYTNPWKEVEVETTFKHELGMTVRIHGFYYDKNIWKVRFNPPEKGYWEWHAQFKTPTKILQKKGQLVSETDTRNTFIKRSSDNPRRLTLDNKNIFNGIGIGGLMLDVNENATPFDDWAIGGSSVVTDSSPFGIKRRYSSDKIIDLDTYLRTYGKSGQIFNLYRWSVDNWSFPLWGQMSTHNRYLIPEGKYGDTLVQSLKNHNFRVFMTIFGFNIPFRDLSYPENKEIIRDYVKYIIARYGAYVDIWEIANEAIVSDTVVKFVADEIKSLDHESRLISMSRERSAMEEIDIISPHWYETENPSESDLVMKKQIEKYYDYDKPIIFGEQGNTKSSWDETSALRMRVRSWVAFFEEAILVFWNQSDDKNFYNPRYGNANLFIGEEERKYIQNLQSFTRNVELSAEKIPLISDNPTVRSYGLKSEKELLGYFYHFANPEEQTSFKLILNFPKESEIMWYDPSTGKVVKNQGYSAGSHLLISPKFSSDIALKILFGK